MNLRDTAIASLFALSNLAPGNSEVDLAPEVPVTEHTEDITPEEAQLQVNTSYAVERAITEVHAARINAEFRAEGIHFSNEIHLLRSRSAHESAVNRARRAVSNSLDEAETSVDVSGTADSVINAAISRAAAGTVINATSEFSRSVLLILVQPGGFNKDGELNDDRRASLCSGTVTGNILTTAEHCTDQPYDRNGDNLTSPFNGAILTSSFDPNSEAIAAEFVIPIHAQTIAGGYDFAWVNLPRNFTSDFGCFRRPTEGETISGVGFSRGLNSPNFFTGEVSDCRLTDNTCTINTSGFSETYHGTSGAGVIAHSDGCQVGVFTNNGIGDVDIGTLLNDRDAMNAALRVQRFTLLPDKFIDHMSVIESRTYQYDQILPPLPKVFACAVDMHPEDTLSE